MYPFSEAANQGIPGILAGVVAAPVLDRRNPRLPAALSAILVNRAIREHWKYAGVVLADDLALSPMTQSIPPEQLVVQAMSAGCDGVLFLDPSADRIRAACAGVQTALDNGALPKERLLQSRDRFDMWQARLGRTEETKAASEAAASPDTMAPDTTSPDTTSPDTTSAAPAEGTAPVATETPPPPIDAQPAASTSEVEVGKDSEQKPPAETKEPEKKEEDAKPAEGKAKTVEQPPNTEKIVHTIEPGESLARIAGKYGVKSSDIMSWNNMKDDFLKYGFKLTIFRPIDAVPAEEKPESSAPGEPKPTEEPKATEEPKPAEGPKAEESAAASPAAQPSEGAADVPGEVNVEELPAAPAGPESAAPSTPAAEPPSESAEKAASEYETYVVKPGDTAGVIAGRYGITVKELAELNGIENTDIVVMGHKLKVPKLPR